MADNKGEEDMEPSANSDSLPSAADNEPPQTNVDNAIIVIEANTKGSEETESNDNGIEAPTPTSDGVDVSSSGGSAGAGGEANGRASNTVSPAGSSSATSEPTTAETLAAVDAPVGGLTSEMSPPPTAPAATPVSAPINLLDTCAVCKQSLQSRDCEPKLLPCLHSFCLKCIPQPERQISVQVPGPHGQTDTHIVNVMRCTVCHQDYKQSDIIDNYFVKDTTEATSTSDEKAAQVCTSCEDNAGTIGFCVECGEWLCKTCVEAHQRVKITKDHKIHTKEDADAASGKMADPQESVGTPGQRPVFCPVHKQEPLKLFCETCDTLTCRDCQLLEHKEHRYQFLEEAFQNQKGIIESSVAKLQEKKNYVHYSVSQVQSRLKELNETHRKVEHEIKIAVFTLINEINKKGKSLLQQLESVTKERSMRLVAQHKDTTQLAQQIHHVLNFCHWAITTGSSTALLYSKRLVRQLFKARMEPAPQANGVVRFFCDPTFWAKNVVNLGNLVIEKPPAPAQPPNVMVGGPPIPTGPQGHPGKHPGQINLAQLRLQHMQQAAYAQQKQQQHQQQHQQQIQQQMRIASQMSQQHQRQAGPPMVQQQPPRLISMQQLPRGPGGMNGGPGPPMYPSSHHMRLPGPPQGRMPTAQPRLNGQQYPPMMQPQLQRQHSNPGHAGPFPVASLHNANPTSPTSASMAGAHAHRGPASPIIGPIELIPSVTNPENLPCLPEIPPIQLEDAGSSNLGHLLSRYITASTQHQLGSVDMNPSPGLSTHSSGSSGPSNAHTPARPSSTSSTGSRGSCSSAGRAGAGGGAAVEQVKVKQEPGTDDSYSCPASSLKTERGKDARSACMPIMSKESSFSKLIVERKSRRQEALKALGERIKTEPQSETPCSGLNGSNATTSSPSTTTMTSTTSLSSENSSNTPLTNGNLDKGTETKGGGLTSETGNPGGKEDDPNEDWGDFLCTFCRSLSMPEIEYCEDNKKIKEEQSLSPEDQRRCERLLLHVFCHELSVGFREPVPSSVPNYYKIIKQPMDLKKVKKKLQLRSSQYYQSIQDFVGSEMAISGKAVSLYFEEKLQEMFPGQSFPETPEPEETPDVKEKQDEDTDDSEEDFIQPRRKRLKTDEKVLHIK
ncbi:E3 ubiquitin-protein ligase TRIM33 [Collichthys lucidus]|uniref:E3 ubiquitin-protein ligase TRIM33 n=1 Tax=Collichthys lucidus TaxID=240159 RepID=A0A4U5URB0_COLLU|nr:E3 ubiquitin-protein ligase TRIM33 [Collichthys lucidus]